MFLSEKDMRRRIILNRILISLGTVFMIITISFFTVNSMPGEPLINIMGEDEYLKVKRDDPELLNKIAAQYGLDASLPVRYVRYLKSIVTLNFGYSYTKGKPVISIIWYRLKWTLVLAIPATILSALIGGWLGILAGWNKGGVLDRILTPLTLLINTVPSNCIALIFLAVFCFKLKLFPISGMSAGGLTGMARIKDIVYHMIMPLSVMVLTRSCGNFINMKSYVTNVKSEEYILTAVSKGVPRRRILRNHVLKNSLLPYVTILCMQFGHIVSGAIMVEVVFTWIGMGNLMNTAINSYDFPTMQMCFLISAVCMVVSSVLSDVLYVALDPRIKEF